ncbi:radical SAM protein [Candidatus Saccharibacteria bacterium]|nr:radical SAM protein [Candidatus Saccharibacteria bacterium]MCL1962831.1 radical SAM protein [Candidatus Saccharibacteria bacterium]
MEHATTPQPTERLRVGFPNIYRCSGGENRLAAMSRAVFNLENVEAFTKDSEGKPDIQIIFGCSNGDRDFYQKTLAQYTAGKIIIAGCAANYKPDQIDWDEIKPDGAKIIVARQQDGESQTVAVLRALGHAPDQDEYQDLVVTDLLHEKSFDTQLLAVGVGCPNACKYCTRRNRLNEPVKSVPFDRTVACIDRVQRRGTRNLIIEGTNTAVYGMDYGESWLAPLIQNIEDRGHFDSMGIAEIAPQNITPELIAKINASRAVSNIRIVVDHTDDNVLRRMNRTTASEVEKIYQQIDPQKAVSSFLIAGMPGEPTDRAYYERMREYLLRNRLFIDNINPFMPVPEVEDMIPDFLSLFQRHRAFHRTVAIAEQTNRILLKSTYEGKFMTARINGIDDQVGSRKDARFATINLFGYNALAMAGLKPDSELQVGDAVDIQVGQLQPHRILSRKTGVPKMCPGFFVRQLEPSDRRPSHKKYDSHEEMLADAQ